MTQRLFIDAHGRYYTDTNLRSSNDAEVTMPFLPDIAKLIGATAFPTDPVIVSVIPKASDLSKVVVTCNVNLDTRFTPLFYAFRMSGHAVTGVNLAGTPGTIELS